MATPRIQRTDAAELDAADPTERSREAARRKKAQKFSLSPFDMEALRHLARRPAILAQNLITSLFQSPIAARNAGAASLRRAADECIEYSV